MGGWMGREGGGLNEELESVGGWLVEEIQAV